MGARPLIIARRSWIALALTVLWSLIPSMTPAENDTIITSRDLAYAPPVPDGKHELDVYAPAGARALPVVVFIHGGGFMQGDRSQYADLGRALARIGVVAVLPSYRLIPNVNASGAIADAVSAVKWTAAHIRSYGGDPKNVILVGHSVGGYLVTILDLNRRLLAGTGVSVRAALSLSGWDYDVRHVGLGLLAASPDEIPIFFGATEPERGVVSPISYARKDAPPLVLLCGGDGDEYACFQRSLLAKVLTQAGTAFKSIDDPSAAHLDTVARLAVTGSIEQKALLDLIHTYAR